MAIFDAVNDTTIRLSRSGEVLGPGTCVNPICIVANYLFDTLCHDIFQVSQSEVISHFFLLMHAGITVEYRGIAIGGGVNAIDFSNTSDCSSRVWRYRTFRMLLTDLYAIARMRQSIYVRETGFFQRHGFRCCQ